MNPMTFFINAMLAPFERNENEFKPTDGDPSECFHMIELVEKMANAIEMFDETGTIEKRLRQEIEFKLWLLNRERA